MALLAAFPQIAFAGPPFVTDDPEPAEFHTWEVNYAVNGSRSTSGTSAYLPGADINYGAAPGVQLHLQLQMAYASGNDSAGGFRHYGAGDTELGIKYRLTEDSEDAADWMVSLYPLVELPTGNSNRSLGAGQSSMLLPVWFQTTRGPWQFYGGGGYWLKHGAGYQNAWAAGGVLLYQFTPDLQLGGELFGSTADQVGQPGHAGFNIGGTWHLQKDYALLFSAGRGLAHVAQTNQASAYLGVQVLY